MMGDVVSLDGLRVALIGAGGKMGCRVTDNLLPLPIAVDYLEMSDKGRERLHDRAVKVV